MCLLPNCRYHIILTGDFKELLQKWEEFYFNYQHLVCLYTLFNYWYSGKLLSSGESSLIMCRGEFISTTNAEEWTPSLAKKRLLRRKYKKHLLSSIQRTKLAQTSGSVQGDRIEQVKKTKLDLELTKFVDCFLDGHGNFTSNLVSFKQKSL